MQIRPGVKLYPSEVTARPDGATGSLPPSLSLHRLNPEGDFIYGVTRIVKVRLHNYTPPTELSEPGQKLIVCLSF